MTRRLLSTFLALLLAASFLSLPAYASSATTTTTTVYKDLSANTEIYRVTDTPSSAYPYYGAKWEPTSGSYFGRTLASGTTSTGGWGVVNQEALDKESAVSFYYSLDDGYTLEYWSYLYGKVVEDGDHALLINLNFEGEASDCTKVINGGYDSVIKEVCSYLGTLSCPVFLRIGAEVNCWTSMPTTSSYISAYRHIADYARSYCPNVALVYSVNFSGSTGVDMDSFYPGDSYVDWIGTSLYYNCYANNGDTAHDAFYGVGQTYGDPMLNVQQTVNLADLHQKPVIITEGGCAYQWSGTDLTSFASERIQKAYSFLTMVYPQIKCLIYSDANFGSTTKLYQFYKNSTLTAIYDKAVSSNPTLLSSCQETGQYYTPLSADTETWQGTVELAAYTYSSSKLTADWYVDGVWKGSSSDYPYAFSFDTNSLQEGSHTITVAFSNGASKSYSFTSAQHYTATKFRDVKDGAYYVEPVLWAVEQNITSGTTDTTFGPNDTCTREQVVTFLWRANGCPEPSTTTNPFTDVKESSYAYKAILWAVEKGITTGTTETTFSPKESCTRGQVMAFLWRSAGEPESSGSSGFTDVSEGTYYFDAVVWAVENGITSGTTDTTFAPKNTCTRAQIVTFLYRYLAD